eukprot:UC1_evm2s1290
MLRTVALLLATAAAASAACTGLDADHCESDKSCYYGETGSCVDGTCFNVDSYSKCKSAAGCNWDWNAELCLKKGTSPPCQVFYEKETCPTTDCEWDDTNFLCKDPNAPLTCNFINTESECTANPKCGWIEGTYCDLKQGLCSSSFDQASCDGSKLGCKWYADDNLCWPSDVTPPCDRFTTTCPTDKCDKITTGDTNEDFVCNEKGEIPECAVFFVESVCPKARCSWDANEMFCVDPNNVQCDILEGDACGQSSECKRVGNSCFYKDQPIVCDLLEYYDADACNAQNNCFADCEQMICSTCTDSNAAQCKSQTPCPEQVICEENNDQTSCKAKNCYWDTSDPEGGYCTDPSVLCAEALDAASCKAANATTTCYWDSEGTYCSGEPPVPEIPDDGKACDTHAMEACPHPRCSIEEDPNNMENEKCVKTVCENLYGDECLNPPSGLQCEVIGSGYCNTKGQQPPCIAYDSSDICPSKRCTWYDSSASCEIPDDNKPCNTKTTEDSCPYRRCQWNYESKTCSDEPCFDYGDEQSCTSPVNTVQCQWSSGYGCSAADDSKACPTHTEEACPLPRCEWTGDACAKRECDSIFEKDPCVKPCSWDDTLNICFEDKGEPCNTFSDVSSCVRTRCVWDFDESSCRVKGCADAFEESLCTDSSCEWDKTSFGGVCRATQSGTACSDIAEDDCPLNRCATYSKNGDFGCWEQSCEQFNYDDESKCNSATIPGGCQYFKEYKTCLAKGSKLPCDKYNFNEDKCGTRGDCSWAPKVYLCYEKSAGKPPCSEIVLEDACVGHGCNWDSGNCVTCKDCKATSTTTTTTMVTTTTPAMGPTPPPGPGPTPPPGPGPTLPPQTTTTASGGGTTTPAASGSNGGGGLGAGGVAAIIISVLVIGGGLAGFMYYRRHKKYDVSVTMSNIETPQDSMDVRNFM